MTTDLTEWNRAQQRAKEHQDAVVHAIVAKLPEPRFNHEAILAAFPAQPNALVDMLAAAGIYRARVPYRLSGNRTVVISEPMDGADVPRLEHTYGGHPMARVNVLD